MENPSIVWFRQDLRIEDQPALHAAIFKKGPVIPLFIWAPEEEKEWLPGGAGRWWLNGALERLQKELKAIGSTLVLRKGSSFDAISEIAKQTGADAVFWNRRYEPCAIERDAWMKAALHKLGIKAMISNGSLLFNPWEIVNKQNKPYQIFTHFWKACTQLGEPDTPQPPPDTLVHYPQRIESESLQDLHLLPEISWDKEMKRKWQPKKLSYKNFLQKALDHIIHDYARTRDLPGIEGTSELSPYLHFGEVSPRMIWSRVRQKFGGGAEAEVFLRQLGWREFAHYLLFHFPRTPNEPLHSKFASFSWERNPPFLQAWQKGMTGYPIVDAGMRQLWQIGWMHNRVRMIAASFLVKDLLIDWQEGARWFWETLVDADLANNTLGWQWVAGCGADAAPYFRIFNPVTQGEKFDPEGKYVRQWVPEIRTLPSDWIHRPWEAPLNVLKNAGVELGVDYPKPIIDHAQARKKALSIMHSLAK